MLLWSKSVWKQYNTDYTATHGKIHTKLFSWVGEKNESKKALNFFVYVKGGGGRATLQPLARMATVNALSIKDDS